MSFHKVPYLYCNGHTVDCECPGGEACSGDSGHETIAAYKADMKTEGWVFRGPSAYCPPCAKKLKQAGLLPKIKRRQNGR